MSSAATSSPLTSSSSSSSTPSRPASTRNSAYERHSYTLADPNADTGDRSTNPVTLTRFLQAEHSQYPSASGRFTLLLNSIQLAVKVIAAATRKAGIGSLYGLAGDSNASGDAQKKLDVYANSVFINCLTYSEQVALLVSEEEDHELAVDNGGRGYVVCFDPLDGSSNIDANLSVGTIFAVYALRSASKPSQPLTALRPGDELVAAGFASYDTATMLTLTTGRGVNMSAPNTQKPASSHCSCTSHAFSAALVLLRFTLDPSIGEFILTHRDVRIPRECKIYSVNEGNADGWEPGMTEYIRRVKATGKWSGRYVGSMVGDVNRALLYGGIFLYPADKKSKQGKLRLLYGQRDVR